MDLFQHRYYRINKILLTIIGQWPYQTTLVRYSALVCMLLLSTSCFVPQVMAIVKYHDDWDFLLECITPLIFEALCTVKQFCSILNSQKMLKLLSYIRADWQVWARDREVNFLHIYAEQGRKMTIMYLVTLCSCGILFMTQPMIPKIIDVLLKNGSKTAEFPIPIDYYHLDMQKYYFYIITHYFIGISMAHVIAISCHTMFIVYVQHCCGVFAALGHKLERIGKSERSAETGVTAYPLNKKDINFGHLISCINRHNRAIKSAELIEATYSWCFFFIVGLNMFMISITGVQIVKRTTELDASIRFIVTNVLATVHLYSESYMSQTLMDHSISIRHYMCNIKWYRLSSKARKLVPLMMMRCNKPCKLTAGKISVMSVKTFGTIMKTSLSYFTLLRTM